MRPAISMEIVYSDWLLQFGGVLIRFRDDVTHGYLDRIAPPQIATIHHLVSHPIINNLVKSPQKARFRNLGKGVKRAWTSAWKYIFPASALGGAAPMRWSPERWGDFLPLETWITMFVSWTVPIMAESLTRIGDGQLAQGFLNQALLEDSLDDQYVRPG